MTIFSYTGPDVAFRDEFCCGSGAGVTEGVKAVEDVLSKGDRDEGSRSGEGGVAVNVFRWAGNREKFQF